MLNIPVITVTGKSLALAFENALINLYEKHLDEFNTGLYSPKKLLSTYKEVMKIVKKYLDMDKNVIIDATFQKNEYREMINKIDKN